MGYNNLGIWIEDAATVTLKMTSEPGLRSKLRFLPYICGEAEADVVCEGENWFAFFPVEPATPGHTLVFRARTCVTFGRFRARSRST